MDIVCGTSKLEVREPLWGSPASATGTGWARTPWRAVQRAAWEADRRQVRDREIRGWLLIAQKNIEAARTKLEGA
jgi:hypothetical protein